MLLDTLALLWFLNKDARLPDNTKQQIENAESVFVSIVSIWEIAIKVSIGKLTLLAPFETLGVGEVLADDCRLNKKLSATPALAVVDR